MGSAKRGRRPQAGGAGGAKPQEAVPDYESFGATFHFYPQAKTRIGIKKINTRIEE